MHWTNLDTFWRRGREKSPMVSTFRRCLAMKPLFLSSIAALFLATGAAHADVKTDIDGYPKPVRTWIAHIHSCSIYRPASDEPATDVISWDEIPQVMRALR